MDSNMIFTIHLCLFHSRYSKMQASGLSPNHSRAMQSHARGISKDIRQHHLHWAAFSWEDIECTVALAGIFTPSPWTPIWPCNGCCWAVLGLYYNTTCHTRNMEILKNCSQSLELMETHIIQSRWEFKKLWRFTNKRSCSPVISALKLRKCRCCSAEWRFHKVSVQT